MCLSAKDHTIIPYYLYIFSFSFNSCFRCKVKHKNKTYDQLLIVFLFGLVVIHYLTIQGELT